MLWVAARKRRRCLLLLFIAIKLTLFCALLIGTSLIMIFFGHDYIPLCPLVLLLPEVYFLWVVLCYMEELKVVGVVGGNPLLRSEALLDIYETEMATMGYYGPGTVITADGKHVFPNYATRGGAVPSATTNATSSSVLLDSTHQDFSAASVQSVGLVRSEQSGDWGVCTSPMPPQPNKETTTTRK
ncbi:uncharacterized protein LOC110849058 [Folsomia candida]|nr:uncharacterized protein LOC110849058 [Folsomia candida]